MKLYFVPRQDCFRIRNLSAVFQARVSMFADICRINVLYMIARAGSGHIGSSFSSLDVVSRIFMEEETLFKEDGDIYFSSKGHDAPGLYAAMIGVGLLDFDHLHDLRRLGGLPGHPDRATPHIIANTGSLGMGVSKAKGIIAADRLRGIRRNIYVMLGDGELQEGQIWESLPGAVNSSMGELIILIDHNKIQSDTWVTGVSHLGDIEGKFQAFGWHTQRVDGHNQESIGKALSNAKQNRLRPSAIILDTIKGAGVSFMMGTAFGEDMEFYPYHSGVLPKEEYSLAVKELANRIDQALERLGEPGLALVEKEPANVSRLTDRKTHNLVFSYSQALLNLGRERSDLVVLDADLVLDCGLAEFRKEFPERFFECGIAEQDMVSQAGSMALQGLLPVIHSFSCFLSTRPNEQFYNNATENSKIVSVGFLAGLLPAGPGHTHQAVRDISALGAVPNLVMIEPSCEEEVIDALRWAVVENPKSTYLRLISIPYDVPYEMPADYMFQEGKGVTLRQGGDVALVSYGPVMLSEAYRAAEWLKINRGLDMKLISLPWLNRLDLDWLESELAGIDRLYTLDNHFLKGGLGEAISVAIIDLELRVKVKRLGLETVPACGWNDEVLRFHGLDSQGIARSICAA
jgi:transketolase